jgi:GNAT superfamily N-acetyltransferase
MVEIQEVLTRKQRAQFVDFPTKLYKNCEYYVHPLRVDEMKLFNRKKNEIYKDCDAVYYLALRDGKVVGRIAGILQNAYNKKTNEKRVRFSRFDSINDEEVAKALFNAVEKWAKDKGMEIIHGPLGFNDLDREGLLIQGFDYDSTFEEQYNYDYYPTLIEKCGYGKEIDWLEYRIFPPKEINERVKKLSEAVLKRFKLRIAKEKSKKKYIEKYKKGIFDVLDEAYSSLYGVVPLTDKLRDQIISQFRLFIKLDYIITIVDENDEIAAFGFAIPSLSEAVRKSKGRYLPFGFIRMLCAVKGKKNKRADLGLIGVRDKYQNKGLPAVVMSGIIERMVKEKFEYCETNLMLEDNLRIQQTWDNFDHIQHKRRRSYVKKI